MHIQVRDDTSCQVLRSHCRSCPKHCSSPWKLPYLCSPRNHHPSNYTWLVGSTVIKSSIYFCRSSLTDNPRSQRSQKKIQCGGLPHLFQKKYLMLCWRSHDLTSCQIYSNTFLRGNHISNPQVPNTKLLAVSNEGEIIRMAEIRFDPHNLHLRPPPIPTMFGPYVHSV